MICAPDVRRLMGAEGLDRLVPVYTSLEAALAAGAPGGPVAGDPPVRAVPASPWPAGPGVGRGDGSGPSAPAGEAVLRQLIDVLDDGGRAGRR